MRFLPLIENLRNFLQTAATKGGYREFIAQDSVAWPPAGAGEIVLLPDLALEMGHPEEASLSFMMWTEDNTLVRDETITLIGPDIADAATSRLPLGKVVLAATEGCDDSAAYDRYRRMDLARFNLSLQGFMLRATSQYLREWSRISRKAVQRGFSFHILGSALIRELKKIAGVTAVEVIYITRSIEAVNTLNGTGERAGRIIQAMNKMATEMEADCANCDFQDVCTSAEALKTRHQSRNRP